MRVRKLVAVLTAVVAAGAPSIGSRKLSQTCILAPIRMCRLPWNFMVELMSSGNDLSSRYVQLMKERTDDGYVKTNESKINLGSGQTVFGRVDEKWYGYKANDTTNPALAALFYGYDETNASWIVATASSGGVATTRTNSALS